MVEAHSSQPPGDTARASGTSRSRSALRVGLLYLAFGAAWILLSDALLPALVQDIREWQTYKGLLFVLASAVVIYLLVRRELAARRRAEERRRASERRHQTMFEQNVAGMFRSRLEGEILACNRALAQLLGFDTPEEVVGTDATAYYADPDQREQWIDQLHTEGEVRNFELRFRHGDGTEVWALMNAFILEEESAADPVLAGTIRKVRPILPSVCTTR